MEKNQKKAYFYAFVAVFFWSTVASAFKLTLRYFDSVQLLLYSSLFSLIFLALVILYQGKFRLLFSYDKKSYYVLALLGIINPFAYYLVIFRAYELLPAQEAQPLNYTWALTLTYLSVYILKYRLNIYDFFAGIICYFGVFIISTHGDLFSSTFSNSLGVFLALFSTLLWAVYWIYNTKNKVDPVIGLFINFAVGVPLIFIWALFFTKPFNINFFGILGSMYVGIFEMGLTFLFWLSAMKLSVKTSNIANLIFISPFLSLWFISLILGEKILVSTFVGLLFIVIGLLLQQKGKQKSE
ncbi:MAG: DMT family transporter [Sulfurospirillaceae bacterium]|nr:DMT family transporter [Sulfurospirillaceae bacterium]